MPPSKKSSSKQRGPRGAGSVFPDKRRGGWRGKAITGRDPATGSAKYTWVRASTQAEALRLKQEAESTSAPATPTMTVSDWSARWLDSLGSKPQTKESYESAMRTQIVPELGTVKLAELTTFRVEQAMQKWLRLVSISTVRRWLSTLSGCLQAALRAELITRNPVRAIKRPKSAPQKFDLFTPEEVLKITELALTEARWRPFAVCAATGCRIGEALSIRTEDYNAATGELTISRTRTRSFGFSSAKSHHSHRTIRVPLPARPALEAGVPTADYAVQRQRWGKFLGRLKIRPRGLHQLRHTLASYWLSRGVPVTDIARYLGDAPETVMRIYCHATGEVEPSQVTDELYSGAKGARKVAQAKQTSESKAKRAS